MPIKGLSDRGLSFPQIGVIRKGSPKEKRVKDGREYEIQGKDLQYFRVEIDESEVKARETFTKIYGERPSALRVTFPFNEIDRVWSAWLEAYTSNRLIARSDGEFILYWKEGKQTLIKNGLALLDHTAKIWRKTEGKHTEPLEVPMRVGQPVSFVEGMVFHRTEKTIVEAKPVGRLRVTLYELKRLGYLLLPTTSLNDIIALGGPDSGELGAIKVFCDQLGLPFAGVPLILRRKPQMIAYTDEAGKQGRMKRWLVHIEADPEFVELALAKSRKLAMPAVALLDTGPEVQGVNEPEEIEEEDIPVTAEEIQEEAEQEAPAPPVEIQMIDPLDKQAVGFAANVWNIPAKSAKQSIEKAIADGRLKNPMPKEEFKKFVANPQGEPQPN
ncbi:MAG: hypothetical protein EHM40_02985 [Chloroflexi bacterium]|nr:MAG: hypothetical protein EHM40_02985 [Chloroflexota bacterium]